MVFKIPEEEDPTKVPSPVKPAIPMKKTPVDPLKQKALFKKFSRHELHEKHVAHVNHVRKTMPFKPKS